jgi:HAD superfamily hydrolase (TIGR01509 family)
LIENIIFDVDGVLAETEEVHRRAFNRAFADFGLLWSWDVALYRDLLRVTGGKERIKHFSAMLGQAIDPDLVGELHKRKTDIYTEMVASGEVELRPGIVDFLEQAQKRGLRLAIATTTSPPNVEALMAATLGAEWRRIFPIVAAGDMVAKKKPAPDVYLLALEKLGREAGQCVAIEDSRNGVQAALAAGLRVIAVRSAYCDGDDFFGASAQLADCTELTLELLDTIG